VCFWSFEKGESQDQTQDNCLWIHLSPREVFGAHYLREWLQKDKWRIEVWKPMRQSP